MARDSDIPLTDADRRNVNASLVNLNKVLVDLEFLESIGVDTSEIRARHAKLNQDLEAFKKRYWPNQ